MSQMIRTRWDGLAPKFLLWPPQSWALRTLTPHLLPGTEALLLCHLSQMSLSLTSSPPGGAGPPQEQAAQLPCSL